MTESPFVPSFGDEPKAEAATGAGQRKICFICSKGTLDMAYPALIMGNAALGEGCQVHIFFTFWGMDMITKGRMENLKFTLAGNTAMHMEQLPKTWSMPQFFGGFPGMTTMATKMMRKQLDDLDIPPVPEMLDIMKAAGAKLWGCQLSYDMSKLTKDDLYEGVDGVISATDFIELSEGGQIIFI